MVGCFRLGGDSVTLLSRGKLEVSAIDGGLIALDWKVLGVMSGAKISTSTVNLYLLDLVHESKF